MENQNQPPSDDAARRKERANAIRRQIERLTHPADPAGDSGSETKPAEESPREFVDRRMRELSKHKPKPPG
ncbi:MAG: hypothetical protein U0Q04_10160 [Microbacterium sp.]